MELLEQTAVVLKTGEGKAWVEARESGACGSCGTGGCSTRRLADLFGRRDRAFPVANSLDARPGDRVVIGIPAGALLRSALGLYGLPLLLVVVGAVWGQYSGGDGLAVIGGAVGLALAAAVRFFWRGTGAWQPVMLRRADESAFIAVHR